MLQLSISCNFRRFVFTAIGILLFFIIFLKNVTISVVLENNTFTTTPRPTNFSSNISYPIIKTGKIYTPGFQYPNSQLCKNHGENVKLVILITSPPTHHEDRRQNIRNTWGHFALRKNIVLGFVLGQHKNNPFLTSSQIKKEIETYDDIIIENNIDSYDNLTLKTLSMLEWAYTYCNQSKYLLKTDDDMWINVENIVNFIDGLDDGKNNQTIYGSLRKYEEPVRNLRSKYSKYFVSFEQYPEQYFPTFTPGPAYLLPKEIWKILYDEALVNNYLKLEDVYFTGILAEKLKIERVNVDKFMGRGGFNWGSIFNYSAISLSKSKDLYKMWSDLYVTSVSLNCSNKIGWTFYFVFLFLVSWVILMILISWRRRFVRTSRDNKVSNI